MKSSYSTLMQSKFFSPAFNSAIFDGPVRIYFAQFHEALALKIYFLIQQKLTAEMMTAKEISKAMNANMMVMIYPTEESFLLSFENEGGHKAPLAVDRWHDDVIIGLRGPIEDDQLDLLVASLRENILNWRQSTPDQGYASSPEL